MCVYIYIYREREIHIVIHYNSNTSIWDLIRGILLFNLACAVRRDDCSSANADECMHTCTHT